jgi:uncharacterized protein YndB with AHSA1/START domain
MAQSKVTPRMSDEAVKAKTGKIWAEWFAILDKAGAKKFDHKGIVAILHKDHKVGPWWEQMVTVTYEQVRGGRAVHEKPWGYDISKSKTLAVPLSALYDAWNNPQKRGRWLKDPGFTIRKATPNKYLRINWVDGVTRIEVNFYPKDGHKSQVAVQHNKLADVQAAQRMKAYWAAQLANLEEFLKD